MLREVNDTLSKPKLRSYITNERKNALLHYMAACSLEPIYIRAAHSRDANDDYLLDLAQSAAADFLVTGDNDLLVLRQHFQTKILNFSDFLFLFDAVSD